MYLYGKNSVLERLKKNPNSVKEVYLQKNFNSPVIANALKNTKIPVKRVSENDLKKIKRAEFVKGAFDMKMKNI